MAERPSRRRRALTVYGDLYFLLNAGVDFVLLWAAGRLGRVATTVWRLLLAAAAGAVYATAQLWAMHAWAFSPAGRVLASVGMVALAYAPLPARRLLALCAYLYAGAVFVAGATLAVSFAAAAGWGGGLSGWLGGGGGAAGRWPEIPWWALAAALGGALLAARAWRARAARQPSLVGLRIAVGGDAASCRGLVDTGNRLVDPLGAGPVVVVEARALAPILPPGLAAALDDVESAALAVGGTEWERRLRLIPFRAVGSDGGLLVGFRPDALDVDLDPQPRGPGVAGTPAASRAGEAAQSGRTPAGWAASAAERSAGDAMGVATVGIAARPLDPAGEYQALVPACLVEGAVGRRAAGGREPGGRQGGGGREVGEGRA